MAWVKVIDMERARLWPLYILLGLPHIAGADVVPLLPSGSAQVHKRQEEAATKKLATCSPSHEESPGPRGTLITYRSVEYDVIVGEITATPPAARAPLRAFVNHFYHAVRPCMPPSHELHAPERLPVKLSILLAAGHLASVVALASDKRVDTACIEQVVRKQESPAIPVASAQLLVDLTLAPFCVITHELQRGSELPSPYSAGFGSGRSRHLIPAPATPPAPPQPERLQTERPAHTP